MAAAAREAGAEIRTDVAVERIIVRDGRVTGVVANGQEIACGTVLSGVDPKTTFLSTDRPGRAGARVHRRRCATIGRRAPLRRSTSRSRRCRRSGVSTDTTMLAGTDSHRAGSRLPRAGVRLREVRRRVDALRGSTSRSRRSSTRNWRRRARTLHRSTRITHRSRLDWRTRRWQRTCS